MSTYYVSINCLPLADAVTLFFLNPAVTAVAAWAICREPLGLQGAAGVAISVAGLLLLSQPPFLFQSAAQVLAMPMHGWKAFSWNSSSLHQLCCA